MLAHEFGHFSQNSMKLGQLRLHRQPHHRRRGVRPRLARRRASAAAARIDIRISVFAWAFTGVLWVLRKGLERLFRGINFANVSLSRQMEYNADLVAVSVTGSDAADLRPGPARLRRRHARPGVGRPDGRRRPRPVHPRPVLPPDEGRRVTCGERGDDPTLGEVPPLPDDPTQTVQVFKPEDTSVPAMWATHPANHDREANAKRAVLPRPDRRPLGVGAVPRRGRGARSDDVGGVQAQPQGETAGGAGRPGGGAGVHRRRARRDDVPGAVPRAVREPVRQAGRAGRTAGARQPGRSSTTPSGWPRPTRT